MAKIQITAFLLVLLAESSRGFLPSHSFRGSQVKQHSPTHQPTALSLAKKRRRKKSSEESTPPSSSNDLPDFDIVEEADEAPKKAAVSKVPSEPSGEISSAMMGSSSTPTRSVEQLIADRSLEKTFEFDEPEDSTLPDLAVMSKENEMGRKKARKEARVAAAIARKEQEEGQTNPLASIPFLTDEKGEVSGVKVSEHGEVFSNFP